MNPSTTPTTRRGRLPKFSEKLFQRVLDNILDGELTRPAIEQAGITPPAFYRNLAKHPELQTRFAAAQEQRDYVTNVFRIESAEHELYRRGVEGWDDPVFNRQGKLLGYKRRYSNRCLLFLLKKRKPEVYGDKPQPPVNNHVQISIPEIIQGWRNRLNNGAPIQTDESSIQHPKQ